MSTAELISHDYEDHRTDRVENVKKCNRCEHEFSSENELHSHTIAVHGTDNKQFDCPICSYRSTTEADITNHVNVSHVYKCKDCQTECSSQEELASHVLETHNTESLTGSFTCNQ